MSYGGKRMFRELGLRPPTEGLDEPPFPLDEPASKKSLQASENKGISSKKANELPLQRVMPPPVPPSLFQRGAPSPVPSLTESVEEYFVNNGFPWEPPALVTPHIASDLHKRKIRHSRVRGFSENLGGGFGTEKLGGGFGSENLGGGFGSENLGSGFGTEKLGGGFGSENLGSGFGTEKLGGGFGSQNIRDAGPRRCLLFEGLDQEVLSETNQDDHGSSTSTFETSVELAPLIDTSRQNCSPERDRVVMEYRDPDDIFPEFYIERDEAVSSPTGAPDADTELPAPSHDDVNADSLSPARGSGRKKKKVVPPRSNTRKRMRNPEDWEVEKRKQALNSGQGFVGRDPKKILHPRQMGAACKDNCNRCEKPRLTEAQRRTIFQIFWKIGNHADQWAYISQRVTNMPAETLHTLQARARNVNLFTLKVDKRTVRVCKQMFLATLGISHQWVATALKKAEGGKSGVSPVKDHRGRHHNRPHKTCEEVILSVVNHINRLPTVQSHYNRENTRRQYLEHGLSIERLYKAYLVDCDEKKIERRASARQYRDIFVTKFNLGFHLPRKDQCVLCNEWKNVHTTEARRLEMRPTYDAHVEADHLVQTQKKQDKKEATDNSSLCVACFDLEKVLTCPRSEASVMFYLRKVSLYNFTVFILCSNVGDCYVWTEDQGKRGANEIGSNLTAFLEEQALAGITEFRFYCDSPTGQNRNRMVFAAMLREAARLNVKITVSFFEPGHSYSEVDSMHGVIEKQANRSEIYSPQQWRELIVSAKQNGEKYVVHERALEDFFDLHALVNDLSWTLDPQKKSKKVAWTKVKQVRMSPDYPDKIFFRYSLKDPESSIIVNPNGQVDFATYTLQRAYRSPLRLQSSKLKDLQVLMTKAVIPRPFQAFYQDLIARGADAGRDSDCDHSEVEE